MIGKGLTYYDDNPNHYHTGRHALMMMTAMDFVFNEEDDRDDVMIGPPSWSRKDRMLLKTAALFHDAKYMPGNPANEDTAVEVAMPEVISRGWMPNECRDLEALILSTRPFELDKYVELNPHLEQHMYLLHDLDWIGFASCEVMMENENRILREAMDSTSLELSYDEALEKQLAFYKKILELAEDPESVVGQGFYRYWKYKDWSDHALSNIKLRVDDIETDKILNRIDRKKREDAQC